MGDKKTRIEQVKPGLIRGLGRAAILIIADVHAPTSIQTPHDYQEDDPLGPVEASSASVRPETQSTQPQPTSTTPGTNTTENPKKFTNLVAIARQILVMLSLFTATASIVCIGAYGYYYFKLRNGFIANVSQDPKADDFEMQCNILALEARAWNDDAALAFLHKIECPGVHKPLSPLAKAPRTPKPSNVPQQLPHIPEL